VPNIPNKLRQRLGLRVYANPNVCQPSVCVPLTAKLPSAWCGGLTPYLSFFLKWNIALRRRMKKKVSTIETTSKDTRIISSMENTSFGQAGITEKISVTQNTPKADTSVNLNFWAHIFDECEYYIHDWRICMPNPRLSHTTAHAQNWVVALSVVDKNEVSKTDWGSGGRKTVSWPSIF